jgi:glutamyl-tRNA synthetase
LCNYLALLGWNPGTEQEFFSRQELMETFTLERISKVNSVFNYQKGNAKFFTDPKLISFNEHYLRGMDIEQLAVLVKDEFIAEGIWVAEYETEKKKWFTDTLALIRDRFHTLKDFAVAGRAYFADDYIIGEKPLKKNILKQPNLKIWLPALSEEFKKLTEFNQENTEQTTRTMAKQLEIKPGILINGMRTVLTGQLAGPSMFDILVAIGKDRVIERLNNLERLYLS